MIDLTDEMKDLLYTALADGYACLLGTASKDGEPQIGPKGSMMVYDRDTLAYWERTKRTALENVGENPNVMIYYNHAEKRLRWRFQGKATADPEGPVREDVMSKTIQVELDRDPGLQGVAVLVKVDKITDLTGDVLQQRD